MTSQWQNNVFVSSTKPHETQFNEGRYRLSVCVSNTYVEALTLSVTIFEDMNFEEVIKVKRE